MRLPTITGFDAEHKPREIPEITALKIGARLPAEAQVLKTTTAVVEYRCNGARTPLPNHCHGSHAKRTQSLLGLCVDTRFSSKAVERTRLKRGHSGGIGELLLTRTAVGWDGADRGVLQI